MSDKIFAPWTGEQVIALNEYQVRGDMHPFTCGKEHDEPRNLIATESGWICLNATCDYTQNWAHAFMAASSTPVSETPRSCPRCGRWRETMDEECYAGTCPINRCEAPPVERSETDWDGMLQDLSDTGFELGEWTSDDDEPFSALEMRHRDADRALRTAIASLEKERDTHESERIRLDDRLTEVMLENARLTDQLSALRGVVERIEYWTRGVNPLVHDHRCRYRAWELALAALTPEDKQP